MVGAHVRQAAHVDHLEMGRHEYVVEGPAQQRVIGVEGGHQAPAHARVEQARHAPKQLGGVRPGHVVHVAKHDGGLVAAVDFLAHQQQLGVALGAGFGFLGRGRLGVQAVEAHPGAAVGQLHVGVQRGNIVVEQVRNAGLFEGQAGEEKQAVGVVEGLVAGVGVRFFEGAQLLVPPGIGFHGHDYVGVGGAHSSQRQRALAVVLQHVHHRNAELGTRAGSAGAVGHVLAHQWRVGHDARDLVDGRASQRYQKQLLRQAVAGLPQRQAGGQRKHQGQHNLQAGEVAHANPPRGVAQQGYQRGQQPRSPQNPRGPVARGQQYRRNSGHRGKKVELGNAAAAETRGIRVAPPSWFAGYGQNCNLVPAAYQ